MKVHITNVYGAIGTWAKAQNEVARIARDGLRYQELGIYHYSLKVDTPDTLRARLDGILASVSFHDVVVIQSPMWNDFAFDERLMRLLSAYPGLKKVLFIHDVVPLMNEAWNGLLNRYIEHYNQADLLIVPSQAMADFLRTQGVTVEKMVIQRMWDSAVSVDKAVRPPFERVIHFAGDPNVAKFSFAKDWRYEDVRLAVTAEGGDWVQGKNISFLGLFDNDNLLANALRTSGGFGLLWSDDPYWREYLKKNASYKLSTYLAAGIPVIVPSDIAEKDTVVRKNLGFAVESLDEAVERVREISEDEYRELLDNVERFAGLLRGGYFTKKALTDAVFQLYCN